MDFSNAEIFLNIKISPYLYSALAGACSESIGQGREKSNHENLERKESGIMTNNTEKNITMVQNEDKNFIRTLMASPQEKKILIQGILIGMDLQEKLPGMEGR